MRVLRRSEKGSFRTSWAVLAFVLASLFARAADAQVDDATLHWMQGTLNIWHHASQEDLHVEPEPLPWIIFYDEKVAWHVNPEAGLLPKHAATAHFVSYSGKRYPVLEVKNEGKLWVPGREPIPLKPQAMTMIYGRSRKPFVIVPSPAFAARTSHVDPGDMQDFKNFLAGVQLHELAHTRQLPQVAPAMEQLQSKGHYPQSLDDNLIQTEFGSNADFRRMHDEEMQYFAKAVQSGDDNVARGAVADGLRRLLERRSRFYVGRYQGWDEMEDLFLALEGSAMWEQYKTALRLAPAGQAWPDTLRKLSERTDAWSQSEGLGLFLLIDRFCPGWQARFFGGVLPSPIQVLGQALLVDRGASSSLEPGPRDRLVRDRFVMDGRGSDASGVGKAATGAGDLLPAR